MPEESNEGLEQSAYSHSLIRAFSGRQYILQYPMIVDEWRGP